MCGFTGFVSRSTPPDEKALRAMGEAIRHRGPDGEGHYTDETCAIAHRRLSILDLERGRQPIVSPDGRFVIAYNGETYNFRELRRTGATALPPTATPRWCSTATWSGGRRC